MAAPLPIKPATAALAQFSPLTLLRMLWLHRLALVLIWLVVSGITAAIVQTLPAVYEAEASILVFPQNIPSSVVQSMVTTNVQDRLATISQQILSNQQLQKVIDDFGLYKKERKDLIPEEITLLMRDKIKVKMEKGWTNNSTGAFKVSFDGEDPAVVAQVANRLAALFIEENIKTRETQVEGTTEFLQNQLSDAKKKLDDSEGAMAQYRLKHNGELPEQLTAINNYIQKLEAERANDKGLKSRMEDDKKTLEDSIPLAEATLNSLLDQDAQAQAQAEEAQAAQAAALAGKRAPATKASPGATPPRPLKESERLEAQLALDQPKYGPNHPEVKRLKMEIAQAKAAETKITELGLTGVATPAVADSAGSPATQSSEAAADAAPGANKSDAGKEDAIVATSAAPGAASPPVVALPKPVRRERPEITQARERIRTLKVQVDKYDKQIVQLQQEDERLAKAIADGNDRLNDVPVREEEIAQLTRDHGAFEAEYNGLRGKAEQAKISTDMELRQKSERFQLNDAAHVPSKPESPNRLSLDFGGAVFGLVLGLVNAFVQEFRKNRLLGAWELPDDVMVLAQVPRIQSPQPAVATGIWSGWGWPRRFAVISGALIPILALAAYAARGYLGFSR